LRYKPWFDKEELCGGDRPHTIIPKRIEMIDYFIVLISNALAEKQRGYVFEEINMALEIDKKNNPALDLRFIIPVKIEDCKYELFDNYRGILPIDLTKEENFSELIKAINQDHERRKKK
jgi:hypothetical protein